MLTMEKLIRILNLHGWKVGINVFHVRENAIRVFCYSTPEDFDTLEIVNGKLHVTRSYVPDEVQEISLLEWLGY